MRSDLKHVTLLIAFSTLLAGAFQGSRGLYETTEGRYAESAREMLETGTWLVPQLDYKPHWTKPPIAYWAIAGGMRLCGENEWGVRLANALAFVLIVLIVRTLAAAMWDERTGLAAGLLYALSPFPFVAASSVHTDLLLSLWEILAVLCYWRGLRAVGTRSERRWILCTWTLLGVAFLTKGPPSLVVLAVLIAFDRYLAATGRPRPRLFSLPGILAMVAIAFSWFAVVAARTPGLAGFFVREEVVARIVTSKHGRNPEWYKPFVIFFPVLLLGAGPAMASWPVEFMRNRALFGWRNMVRVLREDERLAFLAIWLLLPLLIFSLAKSRLPFYVLPIFPAVVLATARVVLRTVERPRLRRSAVAVAILTAAALLFAKGWSARYETDLDMKALYASCLKAEHGRTGFFLYGSGEKYGLQFYLRGRLTRVADTPLPAWARAGVDSTIGEMKIQPEHETYVFITDASWRADALREKLLAFDIGFRTITSGGTYTLFVCRAFAQSSSLAMSDASP